MKYILFIIMANGSVSSAEFSSEQFCELAVTSVLVRSSGAKITDKATDMVAEAWCQPKGGE